MKVTPLTEDAAHPPEAASGARLPLQLEGELVAHALASSYAGRVVDEAEVDAWLDSIGTDDEQPVPTSGR